MATPTWIRRMLELRCIPFTELQHPEVNQAQEVAHLEHVSGHRVAKVVVVVADGRFVELVMPATRHANLDKVRTVLKAGTVRLATESEMEQCFADSEVGALPPLRHWKDVVVLMDRSLKVQGDILFQAGTHTDAIRLNYRDWYDLVEPQVASFSEPVPMVQV